MSEAPAVRILFVCMGNICRSPTAEGVFASLVARAGLSEHILTDSAGTHGYHVGSPPDVRAQRSAARRGYDLSGIRSRRISHDDYRRFNYVLAMDRSNLQDLHDLSPPGERARIELLMDYAPEYPAREVPDPYYGGADGFEVVLDMVEAAGQGLLEAIRRDFGG